MKRKSRWMMRSDCTVLPGLFLWGHPPVLPLTPPASHPGPPNRAELQPSKTTLSASTETTGNTDHTTVPSESFALPKEWGWRLRPPPGCHGAGSGEPHARPRRFPTPQTRPQGTGSKWGFGPIPKVTAPTSPPLQGFLCSAASPRCLPAPTAPGSAGGRGQNTARSPLAPTRETQLPSLPSHPLQQPHKSPPAPHTAPGPAGGPGSSLPIPQPRHSLV